MRRDIGPVVCLLAALALALAALAACESDDGGGSGVAGLGDRIQQVLGGGSGGVTPGDDDGSGDDGDDGGDDGGGNGGVTPSPSGVSCTQACQYVFGCVAQNCPAIEEAASGELQQAVSECASVCESEWSGQTDEVVAVDCGTWWDALVAEVPELQDECSAGGGGDSFDDSSGDDFYF